MSLIAWYKLDGNALDSSGKGNYMNYINDSGRIITSDGKIKSCLEKTTLDVGSDYYRAINKIHLRDSFTMCCWAYVSEAGSSANGLVTNHSHSTNSGAGLTVKYISSTDYRISCNTGNGTSRTFHTYYGTTNIKDKWSHLIVRFEKLNNNLSLWVNGIKEYERIYSMYMVEDFLDIFNWSTSYGNVSSYRPKCKLDDVRIYDHALSTKEIKELSKAKVLHYKFDDFQEPTENISTSINFAGLGYGLTYTYVGIDSEGWHKWSISGIGTSNTYPYTISITPSNILLSTRTSFSFKFKTNVYSKFVDGFRDPRMVNIAYADGYIKSENDYGIYREAKIENVSPASGDEIQSQAIYFLSRPVNSVVFNPATDFVYFKDVQAERKPYATPYVSGTRQGKVKDISGYQNDADLSLSTTPKWVSDSKLGSGAYEFLFDSRNNNINVGTEPSTTQDQTIAMWLYPYSNDRRRNPWNKNYGGEGTITHETNGAFNYYYGTNGGDDSPYQGVGSGASIPLNQWSHIAVVRDLTNGRIKWYINGSKTRDVGAYYTQSAISTSPVLIGTGYTNPYDGKIDDVRLYATALSDDDVKELYQTRVSLDEFGNLNTNQLRQYNNFNSDINRDNLVENGNQEYENNYNFPSLVYDPIEQAFSRTSGSSTILSENYIKLNGNSLNSWEQYKLESYIKGKDYQSRYYFMVACYDRNKRFINYRDVTFREGTNTTLVQNLTSGDTWVYLSDNSNWYDDGTTNYVHLKSLALWHPNDETPYDVYLYTKRTFNVVEVDKVNNRVRLQSTYSGETIPSGSFASNCNDGGTYSYIGASNNLTNLDDYVYLDGITSITPSSGNIRYGTEYVKVGYLMNRDAIGGVPTTLVKNIRFYNMDKNQKLESEFYNFKVNPNGLLEFDNVSEVGITDGLLAWYSFDGNAKDISGNGYNGIVNGATLVSGLNGMAYNFNYTTNNIVIANNSVLNYTKEVTISAWFNSDDITLTQNVVSRNGPYFLRILGSKARYCLYTNSSWLFGTGSSTLQSNTWYNICLTYNGVYLKGYINGIEDYSNTKTGDLMSFSTMYIGYTPAIGENAPFDGLIDEVRIYNRALSEEEIKILYEMTNPQNQTKMKIHENGDLYIKGNVKEV